ncbi:MAG: hypothetical protein HY763_07105 [Planctomycetes bacterium]|nr:hypothetical protein [Planctomycetota bacterium]
MVVPAFHFRREVALLVAFGAGLWGCERAPLTDSGVMGVFGELGLAPGCFHYPRAIAADPRGTVLVVDKSGRIQRFTATGGLVGGWRMPETEAGKPVGLTVHPDGRVFVADTHYHRVLVYDASGLQVGAFGSEGTGDAQFQLPTSVAIDAEGFIYVAEYNGNDRITKWSAGLEFLQTLAVGPIEGRSLSRPTGLVFDDEQTLWFADACNHRLVRLSRNGEILTTFGRLGRGPGELRYPYSLSISPERTLLVCEYGGDRLQWFSKEGRSLRTWGRSGRRLGELSGPWAATYGSNGTVYIVDSMNSRVQILQP